jgi:hypothetical protein
MATNFTNQAISSVKLGDKLYHIKTIPFHATEAEWSQINYIPKDGEIIVYDKDATHTYTRFKIGDGATQVSLLQYSMVSPIELANAIASAGLLKRAIVDELPLPSAADENTIYMKKITSLVASNSYEEWMVISGTWELIGSTKVDLTDYVTNEDLENKKYLSSVTAGTGLKVINEGEHGR